MDFKNVYIGLLIAFVIALAVFSLASMFNSKYASVDDYHTIDVGFFNDLDDIEQETFELQQDVGNNLENTTGSTTTPSESTIAEGRSTFSIIKRMVGFVPSLFNAFGEYLGIPDRYIRIARWAFVFVFALTIAYLLFLGVKKLSG